MGNHLCSFCQNRPRLLLWLIIAILLLVYFPARHIFLFGDDFEILNASVTDWRAPITLLAPINNFFRPFVKLTFLIDYALFGTRTPFYAATTFAIHLLNLFLLFEFVRRHTRSRWSAAATTLLFGISARYSEVTLWASGRGDSLVLTFTLGALLLFSSERRLGKAPFHILAGLLCLGAAGSKEAWIILPVLLFGFLMVVRAIPLRRSLSLSLVPIIVGAMYLFFFLLQPLLLRSGRGRGYATSDLFSALKRGGYLLCKYLGVGEAYTAAAWQIALLLALIGGSVFFFVRQKMRFALWALSWFFLALLPTIFLRYMPSRFSYLPLVGFWLAAVCMVDSGGKALLRKFSLHPRLPVMVAVVCVLYYAIYQAAMLRWEIRDYRELGNFHRSLYHMFLAVRDRLPDDRPVICLNMGKRQVIDEFSPRVQGYRKLLFIRSEALWQLVYPIPLANFAGQPLSRPWKSVPLERLAAVLERPFTILRFNDSGFSLADSFKMPVYQYVKTHGKLPPRCWAMTRAID